MEEEREDLTTQEMAEQAEVTVRTVQRWLKSGKLQAETLPHGLICASVSPSAR